MKHDRRELLDLYHIAVLAGKASREDRMTCTVGAYLKAHPKARAKAVWRELEDVIRYQPD